MLSPSRPKLTREQNVKSAVVFVLTVGTYLHNGTVFTRLSRSGVADQHSEAVVLRADIVEHLKNPSAPIFARKTGWGGVWNGR